MNISFSIWQRKPIIWDFEKKEIIKQKQPQTKVVGACQYPKGVS